MYLPALPTITDELATTSPTVQLTLTGTLLGLALGQLIVGPLSDAFGRRLPLLIGTGVHVVASVLCAVAPNIAVLGGLRVLQGLGAAAGAVIAMAIVRDLYTGAGRGHAAVPADPGDGRRAGDRPDARRLAARPSPRGAASSWRWPCSACC